jgi:hypothetical protein
LCLANQTGIDLQAAFDKKMDLKSMRYKPSKKQLKVKIWDQVVEL